MIVKALLEAGVVTQAFLLDEVPEHLESWTTAPSHVGIGWRYEGGEWLEPAPAPVPVPQTVSRFQARAALMQMGLFGQADAIVQQAGGIVLLAWNDATEFARDSPSILALAPMLGLDDEALDNLFRLAASIRA